MLPQSQVTLHVTLQTSDGVSTTSGYLCVRTWVLISLNVLQRWPSEVPQFKSLTLECFKEFTELAHRVMLVVAYGLNLEVCHVTRLTTCTRRVCTGLQGVQIKGSIRSFHRNINKLRYSLIDWLIDWLIDSFIHSFIHWLIN